MEGETIFEVIIIGGSFAGLSAALSLGRSLRTVLVIDDNNPCNSNTPFSHNFITNDGSRPESIRRKAREQVLRYPSVYFFDGLATGITQNSGLFRVVTKKKKTFTAKKILFATGVKDTVPITPDFEECWGISILHCPYCHGFEVKDKTMGVLGNGDMGFELAKMISHWTKSLTLFTNGTSTLTPNEVQKLNNHNIIVIENEVESIEHEKGFIKKLHLKDTDPIQLDVLFTQLPFKQHCDIPEQLGCELTEKCFIKVDRCMETSIPGIYAAGDCLTLFRSVANAVAQGNKAGAMINKQLIEESFD